MLNSCLGRVLTITCTAALGDGEGGRTIFHLILFSSAGQLVPSCFAITNAVCISYPHGMAQPLVIEENYPHVLIQTTQEHTITPEA